jgi:MYXO-CTERM domain-containing protein
VHPEVVVYAAHCGGNQNQVYFGERANQPAFTRGTTLCRTNPQYQGNGSLGNGVDHAFCILSEPVTDVEIVPILMGCETSILQQGQDVTIVGFGNTDTGQYGIKHQVTTTINNVGAEAFIGGGGQDSCQGDSGGPVYVRLDEDLGGDGTWRVFGITSYGGACGSGGYYSLMHRGMEWMEGELAQYGIDITPCHNSDGTWNPGPECFGFPYEPATAGGTWSSNSCNPGELSGYSAMCGAPFNSEPDDTPPTVSLIDPPDQSLFDSMGSGSVQLDITATADDGDGWGIQEVTLIIDGNEVATDPQPPFSWEGLTFPTGSYTLEARATDYAGNTAISQAHQMGVDEEPDPPAPPPTTGGDEGGSGGESGSDTGAGEAGTGTTAMGTFGDEGFDGDEGSGCACSADERDRSGALGWMGFLLLGLARRRRIA